MVYRKKMSGAGSRIRSSPESLRAALISQAKRTIEKNGADKLSTRTIAEGAYASKNAPYYHFKDGVTEILASVAIEGFEELIELLEQPNESDPEHRIIKMVEKYVEFGVGRAHLYRAMFSSRLAEPLARLKLADNSTTPGAVTYFELLRRKADAVEILMRPLRDLRGRFQEGGRNADDRILAVAALAHGLVGEFIDEGVGMGKDGDNGFSPLRRRMTREVAKMLLHGILADQPKIQR